MAVPTPAVPATGVAVVNNTGQDVDATVTGGTVQTIATTIPNEPAVATPAVPATTVAATNTNPFPVLVALTGGTTTVIAVNGVTVATTTPATVVVPAGGTIAVTYTVLPAWVWTAVFSGISGSPVASPLTFQVPVGGTAVMYYTAAPAWAWTAPEEVQEEPFYAAENTAAELPGYSEITSLPLVSHTAVGQAGLGVGVTN
jgi:hypothetical protein